MGCGWDSPLAGAAQRLVRWHRALGKLRLALGKTVRRAPSRAGMLVSLCFLPARVYLVWAASGVTSELALGQGTVQLTRLLFLGWSLLAGFPCRRKRRETERKGHSLPVAGPSELSSLAGQPTHVCQLLTTWFVAQSCSWSLVWHKRHCCSRSDFYSRLRIGASLSEWWERCGCTLRTEGI